MVAHTIDRLSSSTHDRQTVLLDGGGPRVALSVLSPHIVRVRLAPHGSFAPHRSWAVARSNEAFDETPFDVEETDEHLTIRVNVNPSEPTGSHAFRVHIQRSPFHISFSDASGRLFCREEAGMQWRQAEETSISSRWRVASTMHIEEGEHFYGFGERTGPLERTGRRMVNWTTDPGSQQGVGTDPLYIAIPVFLSVRPGLAYGIFFNNTWRSAFDIGCQHPGLWRMDAEGGELDYYVIYGPTPAEVMAGIGHLLGTMPLPPRWAIGYHQSRWSYAPEHRVREVAEHFRRRRIPCDVIHLDIAYMDGYRVFTWNPERFPNPDGMLADLRRSGFRVVTIIDPGVKIDGQYEVYRQGLALDAFVRRADGELFQGYVWPDAAVFSDYTRPDVREWWGDCHRTLAEQGVRGIWDDMNEPTSFHHPFSQEVFKKTWGTIDMDAHQGPPGERTTHAEVHNLFAWNMARASYEGMRRHLKGERPFVLTRSGFAGVQQWSACWMGDNASWWEHLEMTMPQVMNMGLSGVPFVGVDIGGFAGNASGELFARWMQLGALLPFSRGHTTHTSSPHEPWAFGPEVEEICRRYLLLRYRLLPYLSTLFWEAAQQGAPVLRPLFYHAPDDPETYTLHDQVMLGPFMMAAPIYQPGRTHRSVYFPAGTWYDWWTNARIEGPCHMLVHAPLDTMPLYVRAGAIIPTGPEMCHSEERPLDPLTLHIYPGDGSFTFYEDDGITFAYEQGDYCTTTFTITRQGEAGEIGQTGETPPTYKLSIGKRTGGYTPSARQVRLTFHHVRLQATDAHVVGSYDVAEGTLTLAFADDGRAREIILRG